MLLYRTHEVRWQLGSRTVVQNAPVVSEVAVVNQLSSVPKLKQTIRDAFGHRNRAYESMDLLLDPEARPSGRQLRSAKRIVGCDNETVNPDDLWILRPTYLSSKAYLSFAPTFLLAESYEMLGFGPERCGLCPEKVVFGFDRFPEVVDMVETTWVNWFGKSILVYCAEKELTALREYVKLYAETEPQEYLSCWKRFWEDMRFV